MKLKQIALPVSLTLKFLAQLVIFYEIYVYAPIHSFCAPFVEKIPREIKNSNGQKFTVFTANVVTYSRTLLTIPISLALINNCGYLAFFLVLFHDFLDHLDGIVAKTHKKMGYNDNSNFGGFLDAFCDKLVISCSLWSIMMVSEYNRLTFISKISYYSAILLLICFEIAVGVIRIQDYFYTKYSGKEERLLASSMTGKLKEKLESIAVACLCVSYHVPMSTLSGWIGMFCIFMSLFLAYNSLIEKLKARKSFSVQMKNDSKNDTKKEDKKDKKEDKISIVEKVEDQDFEEDKVKKAYKSVYSVGCFDVFHKGHKILINRMKKLGVKLIIGVHSDESIYKLKKKFPIDPLEVRMQNVKKYADCVFAVPGTDPTVFLESIIDTDKANESVYVRGNDMENFPGRKRVEEIGVDIKFLSYTEGVSSSLIREKLLKEGQVVVGDGEDVCVFVSKADVLKRWQKLESTIVPEVSEKEEKIEDDDFGILLNLFGFQIKLGTY